MPEDDSNRAQVLQAVQGDAVALKLLLTKTRPHLRRYMSRQIPPDLARVVDCEDIVQEAHIEVFRRIGQFQLRHPDSFFRFTAAIAMNRLRNAIKHHRALKRGGDGRLVNRGGRSIEESTIALLDLVAGPGRTPSRSVARGEAIEAVQEAVDHLPEHYQRALRLVYFEGWTVRSVAGEMGRSERAIHGLCRRGLKLLENRLQSASRFLTSSD